MFVAARTLHDACGEAPVSTRMSPRLPALALAAACMVFIGCGRQVYPRDTALVPAHRQTEDQRRGKPLEEVGVGVQDGVRRK